VGFYWSTNASFSGSSAFYEAPVAGCAGGGTVSLNQNIQISTGNPPGTYYLGYKIDDQNEVAECDKGNNGIFYWMVTVQTTATNPVPVFTSTVLNNQTQLVVRGSGARSKGMYYVLSSTNAALPVASWPRIATNSADANGDFIFTNVLNSNTYSRFFDLLVP
jgi:hypothetical protein